MISPAKSTSQHTIKRHEAEKNRRGEQRTATVLRPALLKSDGFETFCLVKNISPSGLKARVYAPIEEGSQVTVQMSEQIVLKGEAIWHDIDQLGIAFEHAVDVNDVIAILAQSKSTVGKPRSPRLQVIARGQFASLGNIYEMQIVDISAKGVKVEFPRSVPWIGQVGDLRIRGLTERKAVPRWVSGEIAGLQFLEPLSFSELGAWLMARYEATDAA